MYYLLMFPLAQAKLDIDVKANPHSKNLVVEEAKRLGARYVVIDRLDASFVLV